MHYAEIEYGFEYGAASIKRLFSDEKKGWVVLSLGTPKYKGCEEMQLYVTKTGKVRVFSKDGEWKLTKKKVQ